MAKSQSVLAISPAGPSMGKRAESQLRKPIRKNASIFRTRDFAARNRGSYNPGMADISGIVQALREEQTRISNAIVILERIRGIATNGRKTGRETGKGRRKRRGRRLSAAARRRISQAAKARWAKAKKAGRNKL